MKAILVAMPDNQTVLVIDDDEPVRLLCRLDLSYEGFEVVEARDGAEGLDMATEQHPDVIVLDRMMPVMDGLTVLRELGRNVETSTIPVLMLTARALPSDKLDSWIAGAAAHLDKPFAIQELTDTVRRLAQMTPDELRAHRADMLTRVRELAS
jgi:DNA-binding response OmpR family regulator